MGLGKARFLLGEKEKFGGMEEKESGFNDFHRNGGFWFVGNGMA